MLNGGRNKAIKGIQTSASRVEVATTDAAPFSMLASNHVRYSKDDMDIQSDDFDRDGVWAREITVISDPSDPLDHSIDLTAGYDSSDSNDSIGAASISSRRSRATMTPNSAPMTLSTTIINNSLSPANFSLSHSSSVEFVQFPLAPEQQEVRNAELISAMQNNVLDQIKSKNKLTIADPDQAIKDILVHIAEENPEIIQASDATETANRQVAIYYPAGLNKTGIATGKLLIAHPAYQPDKLAVLTEHQAKANQSGQFIQKAAFLDDLGAAKRDFCFNGSKIWLMICFTSKKAIAGNALKKILNAFISLKVGEVVIYIPRDAGLEINKEKKAAWLANNLAEITRLTAYGKNTGTTITVLSREELIQTQRYQNANTLFATNLINYDRITDSYYNDVRQRLIDKNIIEVPKPVAKKTNTNTIGLSLFARQIAMVVRERPLSAEESQRLLLFTNALIIADPQLEYENMSLAGASSSNDDDLENVSPSSLSESKTNDDGVSRNRPGHS